MVTYGQLHGYTSINSYFGKRVSPTAGASSFHKGIDIGAPQGCEFLAVCDGMITYVGFLGGGGYTITLSANNMKITYCHVSPNFIVKQSDVVKKGQVIGYVGPKNVYGVPRKPIQRRQWQSYQWRHNWSSFTFRSSS